MKEWKTKSMKQSYIRFFLIVLMIFYFGNLQTYAVGTSPQNKVNEITGRDNYKNDFKDFVIALIVSLIMTTAILAVLKIAGIIAVSWIIVLLPILIPLGLFLIFCILILLIYINLPDETMV